jgi:hypothetical protein
MKTSDKIKLKTLLEQFLNEKTTKFKNNKETYDYLRNFAEKYLKKQAKFKNDEDTREMIKSDYKNIIKIADAIKLNDFKKARRIMTNIDTDVREEIPNAIWDHIGFNGI